MPHHDDKTLSLRCQAMPLATATWAQAGEARGSAPVATGTAGLGMPLTALTTAAAP